MKNFFIPVHNLLIAKLPTGLKNNNCEYATPVLYKIISNDIKEVIAQKF